MKQKQGRVTLVNSDDIIQNKLEFGKWEGRIYLSVKSGSIKPFSLSLEGHEVNMRGTTSIRSWDLRRWPC